MSSKILIYPKFKKLDKPEIKTDGDIDFIANHYTMQLYEALKNHGITQDPKYFKDLSYLREVIKAIVMRTQSEYHSIQDWMDDAYIEEMHAGMEITEDDLIDDNEE